jgi:3-oxoacyl-[acyl-carrier protein] reductase
MTDLTGKTALVTGASRGIGAAAALRLAERGADIALNHLDDSAAAEKIVQRIQALGRKAAAFPCDVSSFSDVAKMVADVRKQFDKLEILINNAGVTADSAIWKMSEEQWDKVIDVNLKGCFNTIRAASPILRESEGGRIVNVSSINGLRGKFGLSNYAASKAGIIGLTKSVARELGKYQVTVNAVAPGFILTDLMTELPDNIKEAALAETALGRLGEPDDVAAAIAFLCSDQARHITGSVIKVDGGQYM